MKVVYLFASFLFLISMNAQARDGTVLATCTIHDPHHASKSRGDLVVKINKYIPSLTAPQTHLSPIYTTSNGNFTYDFEESFDGSGRVGLGLSHAHKNGSASYLAWFHGLLPLSFSDISGKLGGVSIDCQ